MDRCETCKELMIDPGTHECNPRWTVHEEDNPDSAAEVYAIDASDAAEQWAARHDDEGDYDICGEGAEYVVVVEGPNTEIFRFKVTGEMIPSYYAEELPDGD